MRCRFLFWNLGKRPVIDQLCRAVKKHDVDVVALAESAIDPIEVEIALAGISPDYLFRQSDGTKIQLFSRARLGRVIEQYVDQPGSLTIRRFELPTGPSLLLAVVRLPSKLNWTSEAQAMHSTVLSGDIRRVEKDVGHERTIVVGDFNMNPYDAGIVGRQGFNAVMTRRELRRSTRVVQGRTYPTFYNPMWKFFRDEPGEPGGTFFHRGSEPTSHPWNVYDQVLVRPTLADSVSEVAILTGDGTVSLVNRHGVPVHQRSTSDHLPLCFAVEIPGDGT